MHDVVTAPLDKEILKRVMTDSEYRPRINVDQSILKGHQLLTYLNNLDLSLGLYFEDYNSYFDLLECYLNSTTLLHCPQLIKASEDILLYACGYHTLTNIDYAQTLDDPQFERVLRDWLRVLGSLSIYGLRDALDDTSLEILADHYPVDHREDGVGINFVHLLASPSLPLIAASVPAEELRFFSHWFTQPVFKGDTLAAYWYQYNNTLLAFALKHKAPVSDAEHTYRQSTMNQLTKGVDHVPLS